MAATKSVTSTTHPNPTVSINSNTGVITATHTQGAGYVAAGTTTGTLSLAFQPAQTITPGTTNQTIASGKYLTGVQTIKGDANLVASNIAEGISIFGVTGTHVGGGGDDALVAFIEEPITGTFENSKITKIRNGAFASCSSLTTVNFPSCTTIGNNAFSDCSKLTTASFPVCTTIGTYAFYCCNSLTTASFPVCTTIEGRAFYWCYNLTTISFPVCTSIGSDAFFNCSTLTTVSFPACTMIGSYAFNQCAALTTVILNASQTVSSIYSYAFYRCYNFTSLYLLASTIYNLSNINAFSSTPISTYTTSTGGVYGSIFVRSSLYASYIAATNWATYSRRFVSLTDEQVANVMASGTHT